MITTVAALDQYGGEPASALSGPAAALPGGSAVVAPVLSRAQRRVGAALCAPERVDAVVASTEPLGDAVVASSEPPAVHHFRSNALTACGLVALLLAGVFLWPSSLGGCTTVTVVSGFSMLPTVEPGAILVARCGEPEVGDFVVYQPKSVPGHYLVSHRLVGSQADGSWIIRGDNNDFNDPWHVTNSEIKGEVVLVLPYVGRLATSPLLWMFVLVLAGSFAWLQLLRNEPVDALGEPVGSGDGAVAPGSGPGTAGV